MADEFPPATSGYTNVYEGHTSYSANCNGAVWNAGWEIYHGTIPPGFFSMRLVCAGNNPISPEEAD